MKSLFCLIYLVSLSVSAQTVFRRAAFRIDSLPANGVLLDKGWKFRAGDNPNWAKADFNDSDWESIDPAKDIFDLPQASKDGDIFWLRLPLVVSDSASKEAIVMTFQHAGAFEIFLNGKLIQRTGILSKDKSKIKAISSLREPFQLPFQPRQVQTLAVRYAFQPNIYYGTHFANTNKVLSIELTSLTNWYKKENEAQFATKWNNVVGAIFATLFILFFAFYLFFNKQKVNLYFAIYTILLMLPYSFFGFKTVKNIEYYYWTFNSIITISVVACLFLLFAVYQLLNQKIGKFFLFIVFLGISCIPMALFVYKWGWVVYGILFNFLFHLELLRISIVGVLKNKSGAWIIASGGLLYCASWFLFLFGNANGLEFITPYFYSLAQVAIPISVALNLGYNFAQTNRSLQLKLMEVETLSAEKQQILTSQNETLEKQVEARTAELKASQNQLIQKEKLASLGELTAGIAHEIQNPLNFVNNFSEMSVELAQELKDEIKKPEKDWELIGDLAEDLAQNQTKINHHGKRASSIVSGMLEHSRTSTGERTLTDINKLAEEYLRLSYHGMRAKYKDFNSDYEFIADENLPLIDIVPQDIGRVLLNLINNAFYAVNGKNNPKVKVSTQHTDSQVIIKVQDNGTGMSEATKAKIFQPFFTTKPTGEGTGLGLSLAYDIITKGHGGTIEVESVEGEGTMFIVKLPL